MQLEVAHRLGHRRVLVVVHAFDFFFGGRFGHFEHEGFVAETEIFGGDEAVQEYVNSWNDLIFFGVKTSFKMVIFYLHVRRTAWLLRRKLQGLHTDNK